MTIWLLALILLACLAGVGYRQGAIRVSFSLIGIIIAALLAVPLGKLVQPALRGLGVDNPVLLWALAPFIAFAVVLTAFKVGGLAVHQKVDVYYKYKAGDLRLALFERLNARLGLCLGLVNALVYLVLLSFVIYAFSYWTVQMSSADQDPRTLKMLNRLGRDLEKTGMARVARSVDSTSENFYEMADVAGLVYQNPLLEARLSRYPGFLSLGLRPEFQDLGRDPEFTKLRVNKSPIRELLNNPAAKVIVDNPETLRTIWKTAAADLKDLQTFLDTGKSPKYDSEPLLGRWQLSVSGTVSAYRRARPTLPNPEVQKFRRFVAERFAKTSLIAAPDKQVVLKNVPQMTTVPNQPPTDETLTGEWKGATGNYIFELAGGTDQRTGTIEGSRLTIPGEPITLVFLKED